MRHCDDSACYPPSCAVDIDSMMKAPYDAIWKEGNPFVRNEGGVDIMVDILNAIAPESLVMARGEYPQIFQYILELLASNRKRAGLIVIGHPGVGKTLFLYYALGAALSARIPVVLCDRKGLCVLFDHSGVHMVTNFSTARFPRRTMFLVDPNSSFHSPPSAFLDPRFEGVIVQATTPEMSRWRSWSKEVRASFWVPSLWTREEIVALQRVAEASQTLSWVNPPLDIPVYTPVEIYDLLGPCPRTCMHMAGRPKSQDGSQADFAAYLSPWLLAIFSDLENTLQMVRSRHAPPDVCEHTHVDRFLFLSNRDSNPAYDALTFRYGAPTPFLCHMLATHLRSLPMLSQLRAVTLCGGSRVATAPFYLPLALDLLFDAREGRTVHVFGTPNFRIGPGLSLRAASSHFEPGSDAPVGPVDDNTMFVLPPTASSPFHAFVVSESKTRVTLLSFVAVEDTARSWPQGEFERDIRAAIDTMSKVLPHPEEVRWSLVYVALRGSDAKNAAKRAIPLGPDPRSRVRVGWLELRGRDKDAKALLTAFEKSAQEAREAREMWRSNGRRVARGLAGSDAAGSSGETLTTLTEEKGMPKDPAERTKARGSLLKLLSCLGL